MYGLILQKNATCFKEIVEESYLKPLCVIKHTSSCFCSSDYHLSNSREAVDVSMWLYIVGALFKLLTFQAYEDILSAQYKDTLEYFFSNVTVMFAIIVFTVFLSCY